jgi:hypothetical protein
MLPHSAIEGVDSIRVAALVGVAPPGIAATSGKEVSVAC